jgi:hypothetical protein
MCSEQYYIKTGLMKNQKLTNTTSGPLRPARISHHVTTDRTWGHAMRKKLLTASVVQQPAACTYKHKLEVEYMVCYCIMKTYEKVEVQFHISLMLSLNGSKCTTSCCSFFSPGQNCSDIQRILFSLLNRSRQIPTLLFYCKILILVSSCAPG